MHLMRHLFEEYLQIYLGQEQIGTLRINGNCYVPMLSWPTALLWKEYTFPYHTSYDHIYLQTLGSL